MQLSGLISTLCLSSNSSSIQVMAGQPKFMQAWQAVQVAAFTASAGPLIFTGSRTQGRFEIKTETPLNSVASRSAWKSSPVS